jgi:YD repeat-containing protein
MHRNFNTSYGCDAASNRTSFTDPEGGSTADVCDTLNRL